MTTDQQTPRAIPTASGSGADMITFVKLRVQSVLDETSLEDIVLPSRKEKAQLKHRHNSLKHKGGSPPADYTGVEILIDLREALSKLESLQSQADGEGRRLTHAEVKEILRDMVKGYLMIRELRRH